MVEERSGKPCAACLVSPGPSPSPSTHTHTHTHTRTHTTLQRAAGGGSGLFGSARAAPTAAEVAARSALAVERLGGVGPDAAHTDAVWAAESDAANVPAALGVDAHPLPAPIVEREGELLRVSCPSRPPTLSPSMNLRMNHRLASFGSTRAIYLRHESPAWISGR